MHVLCLLLSTLAPQELFDLPRIFPGDHLLAAVDFEGDGDRDLVQLLEPASVRLLENAGGGDFEPRPERLVAGDPLTAPLVLGDLDGDGLADLAIASNVAGAELVLHRGLADGTFAAAETVATGALVALALGDADGDGADDVLVASADALCWASVDGAGWSLGPSLFVGPTLRDVVVVDLDGDGHDDAAASFVGSASVGLARSTAGTLVATGAVTFPLGPAPEPALVVGDLDGDGDADLVAGDAATEPVPWSVALGDGAFGFVVAAATTFLPDLNADQALALDQDGDGDDDLVVGRGPLTSPPFGHSLVFLEADAGALALGVDATVFRSGTPAVPVRVRPAGDVDGDGRPDVLADQALVFGRGGFEGVFEPELSLTAAKLVDLDGDGDRDFYLENLRSHGDGTYEPAGPILPAAPSGWIWEGFDLAVGDFDGDQLVDAIAAAVCPGCGPFGSDTYATHLLRGNGTDLLDPPGPTTGALVGVGRVLDLDGDDDLDVLHSTGVVWRNDLPANFVRVELGLPITSIQDVGDALGDGGVDLWCRGSSLGSSLPTFWLDVGGSWVELPLPVPPQGNLLGVDLDGDGDRDTVYKESQGEFHLLETTPIGLGGTVVLESDFVLSQFRTGDFDADGRPDFVVWESFRGFDRYGFHLSGGLPFPEYRPERQHYGWFLAAVDDVDADGDDDLVSVQIVRSRANEGLSASTRVQVGDGESGAGGARPLLGVTGPLVVGSDVELRLRRGVGGGTAFLGVGTTAGSFADVPFAGNLLLLGDLVTLDVLPLAGAPGVAGVGAFDLPFTVDASFAGLERHAQFFVVDAAAGNGLLAGSNRLTLRFGS